MMYTSELAALGLALAPRGTPHQGPEEHCAMCGRRIARGMISILKDLPKSFTDHHRCGTSDYLCGYCAATSEQVVMRSLQRAVITANGIYALAKDDARAWLWMTPPPPPFAVVISNASSGTFHLHWRTPVTLSVEVITMNVDDVIYQVRRSRVLEALTAAKLLGELAARSTDAKTREVINTPFMKVSRDPSKSASSAHGRLKQAAYTLAQANPGASIAIQCLEGLSPGELIAVSPFLKKNPVVPVQPDLIHSLKATTP